MQFPAVAPLLCLIRHVLRLDLRASAQSPNSTPAHGRYGAEPRCPEAGVSDQDRANIVRNQCPQLLQEAFFCTRRSLLLSWHQHVQQGECAAAHRHRCAQQTPRFVWLQIAPVDDDYRLRAAHVRATTPQPHAATRVRATHASRTVSWAGTSAILRWRAWSSTFSGLVTLKSAPCAHFTSRRSCRK